MKKKLSRQEKQQIRIEIWKRQDGKCLDCGKLVTLKQMHCHEKKFRSKGGQMSLENSIGLCYDCHINGRHSDRTLKSGRKISIDISPEI